MTHSDRLWDLALDQPGSASLQTLRKSLVFTAIILAVTIAVMAFRDVQLAAYPQFATFHAGFVLVVDGIVAFLLFGQFAYRRQLAYAILGVAYLFSALVVLPFLLSFPGALQAEGVVVGGSQSSIWIWHVWHIGFPLIVALALLVHERAPGRIVAQRRVLPMIGGAVAVAVVLAAIVALVVIMFHARLPVMIMPDRVPLTSNFYLGGGIALAATVLALALAVWSGRRRAVLHVWLAVALTAFLGDVVASMTSSGRYTVGWYFGRVESMAAAGILLLVFLSEINHLYYKLGATVGDLFVANRKLSALIGEKGALVAELRLREEKIRQLAYFDPVTELPNRRMLMDRLSHDMGQGARLGHSTALLFLDLDKFKSINDRFGHEAGDALLHQVAERLIGCVRSGDTVSRLGGDEFVVVLPQIAHPDEAIAVAEKVIHALGEPMTVAGRRLDITASIGIALSPPGVKQDPVELLARADAAMYAAKKAGRNGYSFGGEPVDDGPPPRTPGHA